VLRKVTQTPSTLQKKCNTQFRLLMIGVFRFLIVLLVFSSGTTTAGNAASFDCAKATNETEIAICNDTQLSKLDEDLGLIYSALLEISDKKQTLITEQREWVKSRDNAGADFVDLFSKMSSRIAILSKDFNFRKCIPHFHKLKLDTCFKVFSKIALKPIPVELLRIGDGLSMEIKFNGVEYAGSYSEKSLDFIYDWEENKTVYYMWSPERGLFVFNPFKGQNTEITGFGMYHPITNAHLNFCDGWSTDSKGNTSYFCKQSALDLWTLELDWKLRNIDGKNEIKKSLLRVLSAIPSAWGKLELIEDFVHYLPDQ